MEFKVRKLIETDYENLVSWWKWFRFTPPSKEFLPQNGLGGIMVYADIDVCAGFLYRTDSKIAWLEFIVSNPKYRNKDRQQAIKLCISSLSQIAKKLGYNAIFTSVKHESLINHFKDCGFFVESGSSKEMTLKL
jgi:hypothetical protein